MKRVRILHDLFHENKKIKMSLVAILAIFVLAFFPPINSLNAQSSTEIGEEIDAKKAELEQTEQDIENLNQQIANSEYAIANATDGIPKLELQIEELETKIELSQKQVDLVAGKKELKRLEKEERELKQTQSLFDSYRNWRLQSNSFVLLPDEDDEKRISEYNSKVIENDGGQVITIAGELTDIGEELDGLEEELANLQKSIEELAEKKKQLENEIIYFNSVIASSNSQISTLTDHQASLQSTISNLLVEQREAAQREAQILANIGIGGGSTEPPFENENSNNPAAFRFTGQGRDLYQGHGVGMSQFGAYGGANSGMSASQIARFYYAGSQISGGYSNQTINVQGYGNINLDDYVAGLGSYGTTIGEIPAKACGSSAQQASNPDKYAVVGCWPEEAIKAMAIVYRTYALYYTQNYGPICTTSACQVYTGTNHTRWAAEETSGQVLTVGGGVIEALYSSDNSQGAGTANNDTVFQNFSGDGNPVSYLRSVNDSAFAEPTEWTYWGYSSGHYTYTNIDQMLNYIANNSASGYSQWVRNEVNSVRAQVGSINSITFERDPSGRVKKVFLNGTSGTQRSIGGWWFKNFWNTWVYGNGTSDYIYSQTFYMVFNS